MERDQKTAIRNRREHPRHSVDEPASLVLVHHGAEITCRIIDLSVGGCQICAEAPFLAGSMVRVEIVFKVLGETFRIAGVTQWTRQKKWLGVRFLDVSERKRAALVQLINEIAQSRERRQAAIHNPPDSTGPI